MKATCSDTESLLVRLRHREGLPTMYCAGGADGSYVRLVRLAHELRDSFSTIALRPRGLVAGEPVDTTIEATTDSWYRAIRAAQPRGPYFVGGHCFGGVLAHDVAVRLQDAGERVTLFLLEANYPWPKLGMGMPARKLATNAVPATVKWLAGRVRRGDFGSARVYASRLLQLIQRRGYTTEIPQGLPPTERAIWAARARAFPTYVPRRFHGRAIALRAEVHTWFSLVDDNLGWGPLINDLRVTDVAGGHLTMLQAPFVKSVARELSFQLLRGS